MDKVSRYLVISDSVYVSDRVRTRLVFSTRTARVLPVEARVAEALRAGAVDAVPEHWVEPLRKARVLVPSTEDELDSVLQRNRRAAGEKSYVHIGLLPTTYCNMGCSYCGQEHRVGRLGPEHRDRVRKRVLRALSLPTTTSMRLDWFGAEPMVGYPVIRDLSADFVRVADEHGVDYRSHLVTNGSLLTAEKIDHLIRQCRVRHIEITLDGPPEVHDSHRPLKNGKGSFWKIVDVVGEAAANEDYRGTTFGFRTNVDVNNQDSIARYVDIMGSRGFDVPNVFFYMKQVHSWGNDVSDIEVGMRDYAANEVEWLRRLKSHGLTTPLVPNAATTVVCPAVTTSAEIISSTGNIFSCSEYPLVPEAEKTLPLANIWQDDLGPHRPVGPFDNWNDVIEQGEVSSCSRCPFLPVCGGACPKAWHEGNPPCPSYKFNMQQRLDLLAQSVGLVEEARTAVAG